MTTEFHDDSERPQPLGLGSSEGLGARVTKEKELWLRLDASGTRTCAPVVLCVWCA